jgi:hypothetical protein
MIVAVIALILAASGTGWAVTQLPKNSVGTTQLKSNAVVSSKVKDGSLRAADFATGQLPAGATGATGARGPSDAWVYTASSVTLGQTETKVVESATLPAGSYTTIALLSIENSADASLTLGIVCSLTPSTYDTGTLVGGERVPVTLAGAVTLTTAGTISATCRRMDAAPATLNSATLVITRVATLATG